MARRQIDSEEVLHRVYDALYALASRIYDNPNVKYTGVHLDVLHTYHAFLDRLEQADFPVAEWRIPDEDITPAQPGLSSGGAELHPAKVTLDRFTSSCVPLVHYLRREMAKMQDERETRRSRLDGLKSRREALLDTFVTAYLEKSETIRGLSGDDVVTLYHPGFPDSRLVPDWGDVEALANMGRVNLRQPRPGQFEIEIPVQVLEEVIGGNKEKNQIVNGEAPQAGNQLSPHHPAEVWVIFGRDLTLKDQIFDVLRKVHLRPIEFGRAVRRSGSASPFVLDVVLGEIRRAPAIVALLSADESAELRPDLQDKALEEEHRREAGYQPRPNVLLETGMALALMRERTLVVKSGHLRSITDIQGLHELKWDNSAKKRFDLVTRLEKLGLPVDKEDDDWIG